MSPVKDREYISFVFKVQDKKCATFKFKSGPLHRHYFSRITHIYKFATTSYKYGLPPCFWSCNSFRNQFPHLAQYHTLVACFECASTPRLFKENGAAMHRKESWVARYYFEERISEGHEVVQRISNEMRMVFLSTQGTGITALHEAQVPPDRPFAYCSGPVVSSNLHLAEYSV